MHLASVTLRGFKSFADRTTLECEPGLVAVVGPNGAGKSNLIDALIWCLGTLSTRALRLERMEDVIFTGTLQRKALGMAQVLLAFDNASGTFPVDVSQVQIGRTLYRDGASEYTLNGTPCRLLDIQDLLSEAGIGRELHAVVAQGQVDEIVQSRPEELRSHVEEAAGISKHRRRKERALRKIEQVDQDISRVADLASELRRQLRPLRAQAEQAVRHKEITERLRELRIRLLVAELESVEAERSRALAVREGATGELDEMRATLGSLRNQRQLAEGKLEEARRQASSMRRGLEHLRAAQASALRAVVMLRERAYAAPDVRRRDTVAAKLRALDADEVGVRGALETAGSWISSGQARAAALREERNLLREGSAADAERLGSAREEARAVEAEAGAAEQTQLTARAEGRAAAERLDRAADRIARIEQQAAGIRGEIERLDAEEGRASLTVERLESERREANSALEEADGKLRAIESEAAVLAGRLESLRVARDLTLARRQGAESLRRSHGVELGIRGVLAEVMKVASGLEAAVEASLGPALDALVLPEGRLSDALRLAEEAGKDVAVVPTLAPGSPSPERKGPLGSRPLASVVETPGWLRGTVDALLDNTYLLDTETEASEAARLHPEATFVTPRGRVVRGRGLSRPAPSGSQPGLGIAAALERTEEAASRLDSERGRWTTNRDRRRHDIQRLEGELEEARSVLHEIEGRIAAAADRLRELGAEEHGLSLERDHAEREREERMLRAESAAARREELAARERELRALEGELVARMSESSARLQQLDAQAKATEDALTELLQTRASLSERLRGIEESRGELEAERALVEAPPTDPRDLEAAEAMLSELDGFVSATEGRVRDVMGAEEQASEEFHELSGRISRLEVESASLEPRSLAASESLARLDARREDIGSRLARDFDIPPSRARREFPPAGDPEALATEERRLDSESRRIGPVNPLAAEEIVELEQRSEFLDGQLNDLRSSKRELMKVVRATEERMRELLAAAVRDADERFREVIGLLFPEGDGRLRLTGSEDALEAGLEIEVKLGRKGHRRLGFLSGGEKALAGLGFLFALHLARPTPFLVLDEVDAPLDDANLGRFLRLLDALRTQTQVLVVTHQKRTMERADSLVGVTLNGDGTSRLVTQSLRERTTTTAS